MSITEPEKCKPENVGGSDSMGLLFAGIVLGVCIGWPIIFLVVKSDHRTDAVKAGHASWVPDASGNAEFKWKPVLEKP